MSKIAYNNNAEYDEWRVELESTIEGLKEEKISKKYVSLKGLWSPGRIISGEKINYQKAEAGKPGKDPRNLCFSSFCGECILSLKPRYYPLLQE